MQERYNADLQEELPDEMIQFVRYAVSAVNNKDLLYPNKLLHLMRERELQNVFPNVDIALRLYLTLPVSNASGERSFSKLGIVKNQLRTSMGEDRLVWLTLMSIEYDLLRSLDFNSLIQDFAGKKSRKKPM